MGDKVEPRREFIEENAKYVVIRCIERKDGQENDKLIDINIEDDMKILFDYSMSVIVSRALPDVRDGLKPVHRRINMLWMN